MNDTTSSSVSEASLDSTSLLAPPNYADPNLLINYIRRVSINVLEEEDSTQSAATLQAVLVDGAELIKKFIGDPQVKSIFIQKISNNGKFLI